MEQTCPPMTAHWRHLANTIEFVLLSAHPSPQIKTANRSVQPFVHNSLQKVLYLTMGNLFPKTAPSRGGSGPPRNSWFLEPDRAHNPNGISIGSAVLAQMTAEYTCFTMGRPYPPQNCPLPSGDLDPNLIHGCWFPGPTRVLNPNGISIGSPIIAGLTSVTDIPTDQATQSVTIDNIQVHSMRSNKDTKHSWENHYYYYYFQFLFNCHSFWGYSRLWLPDFIFYVAFHGTE